MSALHDDALRSTSDRRVRPATPIMLVVLVDQQHLVPLGTLRLVYGQRIPIVECAGEIIVVVVVQAAALLDKHAFRYLDLNAVDQQTDRSVIRLEAASKLVRDTVEDAVLVRVPQAQHGLTDHRIRQMETEKLAH